MKNIKLVCKCGNEGKIDDIAFSINYENGEDDKGKYEIPYIKCLKCQVKENLYSNYL